MARSTGAQRQELKSAATRRALVQAAVDVISEVGYAAATTTLIAERAGVSRGAFQHHFKSRNEIIVAVLNEMRAEVNLGLDTSALADRSVAERVEAILTHYYDVYGSKLHAAAIQIWLGAWSDSDLRKAVKSGLNLMDDAIIRAWRDSFPELEVDDARLMSIRHVIISTIRGSTMLEMWYNQKRDWGNDFVVLRDFLMFYLNSHGISDGPPAGQATGS